jgi:hypothetical protein
MIADQPALLHEPCDSGYNYKNLSACDSSVTEGVIYCDRKQEKQTGLRKK